MSRRKLYLNALSGNLNGLRDKIKEQRKSNTKNRRNDKRKRN